MSKPTNEPTGEPNKQTELPNILTSKQGMYSLSEKQDEELPSMITVSITQFCYFVIYSTLSISTRVLIGLVVGKAYIGISNVLSGVA
jgi:hypothetical protein